MSEFTLGTLATIALGICVVDCFFWMWGGREGKWRRRFLGSAVQILGINILAFIVKTWVWPFLLAVIPEIGSRIMGYGGNNTIEKVIRRTIFAAGSLCVGIVLAWGLGFNQRAITILICQVIASISSILLGVKNPLPAAVEEVFVCISLKYFNYSYLFVGAISL